MKTFTLTVILGLFLAGASGALAGNLTIPNTFVSGTKALASEVNANFDAVKTEVDDNNLRMPGVAYVDENTCCTTVGTTAIQHMAVTINAPATGYVIVSYAGICRLLHVNAATTTSHTITVAISSTSGTTATASRKSFTLPGNSGDGVHQAPCSTQQVFPVTTGNATFYVNAIAVLPQGGDGASIGFGNLQALFVPNQY